MENILFINACIRPESRSEALARHLLAKLDGTVTEVKLSCEEMHPLTEETLKYRQEILAAEQYEDPMLRYSRQFRQADTVVIAAPYYDLSFSSLLKVYIENICCVGLTFYYDDQEIARTLCQAKKLYYVSTGGDKMKRQFGFQYIQAVMEEFFQIPQITGFFADRLDLRHSDPQAILRKAKEDIDRYFA